MSRRSVFGDPDSEDTSQISKLLARSEEKQKELETSGRGRPGTSGKLGLDSMGRKKMTLGLPLWVQEELRKIASIEDVTISSVGELAIRFFIDAYEAGMVDMSPWRIPAKSIRGGSWELEIPESKKFFTQESDSSGN